MKRIFENIIKLIIARKAHNLQSEMSRVRYFQNPSYDKVPESPVQIPVDMLRNQVSQIVDNICINFKPLGKNAEDGLYLGTGGVGYMFYHLSKAHNIGLNREAMLTGALEYIKPAIEVCEKYKGGKSDWASLLLGNAGIYVVSAAIFHAMGDKEQCQQFVRKFYEVGQICKKSNFLDIGCDELFVGRTGFILASLWLSRQIQQPYPEQDIEEMCSLMVDSGRAYARRHRSACPLMYSYYDVEYLGAGHGLCAILQTLLTVPGYLDKNPADFNDVKTSVDYLLSLQDAEGNYPCATDEIRPGNHNELIHWCHGAGGVIYLMAKAYLVWKEPKYLESCILSADLIWKKGLLKKGPGICHGVAGNGYVFLLMYRLTNEEKYLYWAIEFARFMESEVFKTARIPDNPFSLYEGVAGTACYLADVANPSRAAFPFYDIFY